MPTTYQGRGTSRITQMNVIRYLKANPGSTAGEVMTGTQLSAPTVRPLLNRIASYSDEAWPRRWTLLPIYENYEEVAERIDVELAQRPPRGVSKPLVNTFTPEALRKVWPSWEKATIDWPKRIARMSRLHDPREIQKELDALSYAAATLSQAFKQVRREPDWVERLGGR